MGVSTLRIWLSGPLQSWETASRFEVRTTDYAPSKSAVVGLVAAAMGRRRDEPVDDMARLRFGVRIERPGTVLRDFHTVGTRRRPIAVANKKKPRGIVTQRYYLEDAAFVAGFEAWGDDGELLRRMRAALESPRWLLALGRRSCPPAWPLVDETSIFAGPLREALAEPWWPGRGSDDEEPPGSSCELKRIRKRRAGDRESKVELRLEDPDGPIEVADQPLGDRSFMVRRVRTVYEARGDEQCS